jgi:hypothetical protein
MRKSASKKAASNEFTASRPFGPFQEIFDKARPANMYQRCPNCNTENDGGCYPYNPDQCGECGHLFGGDYECDEGSIAVALIECQSAFHRSSVMLTVVKDLITKNKPTITLTRCIGVLSEIEYLLQDAHHEIVASGVEI